MVDEILYHSKLLDVKTFNFVNDDLCDLTDYHVVITIAISFQH